MVTDDTLRLDIHRQINIIFIQIIDELPRDEEGLVLVNSKNYLTVTNEMSVVEYGLFCRAIYEFISLYIPNDKENPLIKAIKMLPRTFKNLKIISANKQIIEKQHQILSTYFASTSTKNVKNKIFDLKTEIDNIFDDEDNDEELCAELAEAHMNDFDDWMRKNLLNDLCQLSELMEQRRAI